MSLFSFKEQFVRYGEFHANRVNQIIHVIFVPTILWSALVWVAKTGILFHTAYDETIPINGATIVATFYAIYYVILHPVIGLLATPFIYTLALSATQFAERQEVYGMETIKLSIAIHILSWAVQIFGHQVYEKRAPAVLDDPLQPLVLAPLFVFCEVLFAFGLFPTLRKNLEKEVSVKVIARSYFRLKNSKLPQQQREARRQSRKLAVNNKLNSSLVKDARTYLCTAKMTFAPKMEKFSHWRDAGTGIHPFLHLKPPRSDSGILKYFAILIRFPIALIKFILIAVFLLLFVLLDNLLNVFILDLVVYWAKFILLGLITRIILFLAGFYYIESEQVTRKRGEKFKTGTSVHLIVSNHSSYIDYLYHQFRYNPIFLNVALDGRVYESQMMRGIWNCSSDAPEKGATSLNNFLQTHKSVRPIVLFPEGTTTNGRGLLEFGVDLSELETKNVRIDIIGLKYVWNNYCPCFTTGSVLGHFYHLLNQFYNTLQVKEYAQFNGESDQIASILVQSMRIRKVAKTAKDKADFMQFFLERESKDFYKNK